MSYIIVFVTTCNKEEGLKIAKTLLKERIIACANIIEKVSSLFWWKGKIDEEEEVLLIMKSHQRLFNKLSVRVKELHSYEVPEILAFPIVEGSKSYLNWMKKCIELGNKNG